MGERAGPSDQDLLLSRLAAAGVPAESVESATGGVVAVAGLVTMADGSRLFAKTLPPRPEADPADLFEVEAEGLRQLRELGGVTTPDVVLAAPELLVLRPLREHPDDDSFWERLGRMVAGLHTSTVSDRFGWHRDGWLGRLRQENTWADDGHAFFAQRRILRWLPEPLVAAEFDRAERQALERLCVRLPELVPAQPPVLTHGDLWNGNILADCSGAPALVDPAVSYTWSEVDLSMLWCSPRPPAAERFFAAYAELARPEPGWRDRMRLLFLRELLSVVAHGDDDWGAAEAVRELIAPFRRRT